MPLPVVVAGALVVVPLILEAIALIISIVELVQGDGGLMDRAQEHSFKLDAILAELDPTIAASLRAILDARTAVILADTQELTEVDVPAILAAIAAIEGGGGGGGEGGWTEIIGVDRFGAPNTAGEALQNAFLGVQLNTIYGLTQLYTNPDFAIWEPNQFTMTAQRWDWLAGKNVRDRAAGVTIGAYLNSVTSVTWLKVGEFWRATVYPGGAGTMLVWCLVTESGAGGGFPDYSDELAAIKADTEGILSDTGNISIGVSDLLVDVTGVSDALVIVDGNVDTLITRTVDTAEADDKIIATDFTPEDPADLGDIAGRVRQYMPLKGEGTIGLATVISGSGTLFLGDRTSIVLVDVIAVPPGWWSYMREPEWFKTLGTVTFGFNGSWGQSYAIHRLQEWIRVPAGADSLAWKMEAGMECTIQLVAAAE